MFSPRDESHDRKDWAAHGFFGEATDLIAEGSLPKAWASRWRQNPDANVFAEAGFDGTVDRWVTGAELDQRTSAAARRFHAAGVRPGDRIVMSCAPSVDLVIAHVGALRLGAIVVTVNPAYSATEVARVIDVARPTVALADDRSRMVSTDHSFLSIGSLDELASLPSSSNSAPSDANFDATLDTMCADDPAMLMFTSGTTGAPKGVVLSHGNILASAEALRIAWQWKPSDRLILALP